MARDFIFQVSPSLQPLLFISHHSHSFIAYFLHSGLSSFIHRHLTYVIHSLHLRSLPHASIHHFLHTFFTSTFIPRQLYSFLTSCIQSLSPSFIYNIFHSFSGTYFGVLSFIPRHLHSPSIDIIHWLFPASFFPPSTACFCSPQHLYSLLKGVRRELIWFESGINRQVLL